MSFREKVLIIILAFAASGAAYFYFYWQPVSTEISNMETRIEERASDLDDLIAQTAMWSSLKAEADLNARAWNLLNSKVPDRFDQSSIITTVEEITSQHAEDVTMKFEKVDTSVPSMILHPMTITLNADYDNIVTMLRLFSSQDIACRVAKLSLRKLNESTQSYAASFVLEYPEKAPPPVPEESESGQ